MGWGPDGEAGVGPQDGELEPSFGSFDRNVDQTKSWRQHDGPSTAWAGIDAEVDDSDRGDDDPAEEADNGMGDAGGLTEKTVGML